MTLNEEEPYQWDAESVNEAIARMGSGTNDDDDDGESLGTTPSRTGPRGTQLSQLSKSLYLPPSSLPASIKADEISLDTRAPSVSSSAARTVDSHVADHLSESSTYRKRKLELYERDVEARAGGRPHEKFDSMMKHAYMMVDKNPEMALRDAIVAVKAMWDSVI